MIQSAGSLTEVSSSLEHKGLDPTTGKHSTPQTAARPQNTWDYLLRVSHTHTNELSHHLCVLPNIKLVPISSSQLSPKTRRLPRKARCHFVSVCMCVCEFCIDTDRVRHLGQKMNRPLKIQVTCRQSVSVAKITSKVQQVTLPFCCSGIELQRNSKAQCVWSQTK